MNVRHLATVARIGAVVLVAAALGGGSALAATVAGAPRPDAHDRAAAHLLEAKVAELTRLTRATKVDDTRLAKELDGCKNLGKTPAESFGVVIALLPVLLIQVVQEIQPQLLDLRTTLDRLHPHALLFRRWLAAERAGIQVILAFDNHGKPVDVCKGVQVMLAKNPSDAEVQAALGIPLARIKALFTGGLSQQSATVKQLNPRMRAFLIAAGVERRVAVQLTS